MRAVKLPCPREAIVEHYCQKQNCLAVHGAKGLEWSLLESHIVFSPQRKKAFVQVRDPLGVAALPLNRIPSCVLDAKFVFKAQTFTPHGTLVRTSCYFR